MKTKRKLILAGIVIGALLTLAPVIGTVFGMTRAFGALGSSGIADPNALSEGVGVTLASTATGLLILPVGILILTLSLVSFFRLRASSPPPLPPQPTQLPIH